MKLRPLLLILEAVLALIGEQLRCGDRASRADLKRLGRQLHRVNRAYLRFASSALEGHDQGQEAE
jgi:hypothetical protein